MWSCANGIWKRGLGGIFKELVVEKLALNYCKFNGTAQKCLPKLYLRCI